MSDARQVFVGIYAAESLARCDATLKWAVEIVRDFLAPLVASGAQVFALSTGNDHGPGWGLEPSSGWVATVVTLSGAALTEYRRDGRKWVDGVLTSAMWLDLMKLPPGEVAPIDDVYMRGEQIYAMCHVLRRVRGTNDDTYVIILNDRVGFEPYVPLVEQELRGKQISGLSLTYPDPIQPGDRK